MKRPPPQSYAEWREQTLQKFQNGQNSIGSAADMLQLEAESESDLRKTPRHRSIISADNTSTSPYSTSMALNNHKNNLSVDCIGVEQQLASGCLTPVRSITEIYRSAETRLQKLNNNNNRNEKNKQEMNQRKAIMLDDDEDFLAASSDEGNK